jgi:hypothetical protein
MSKSKPLAVPTSTNTHVSVGVEKIKNGYLVRTSRSDAKGYHEETVYSKEKPKVDIPAPRVVGGGHKK